MCEEIRDKSAVCEDIESVISLPTEVPYHEYSENLGKYVDKKQQEHDNIIERMRAEVELINLSVDKDVQQLTDRAKEEIEWMKNELDEKAFDELKSIAQWNDVNGKNKKRRLQMSSVIEEYSEDLKSLEQQRAKDITRTLSRYKEEAIKLRFLSIGDIEKEFQDEIMAINEKTLALFQSYEDLKLRVQVDIQETIDKCQQALKDRANFLAEEQAQHFWGLIKAKQSKKFLTEAVLDMAQDNSKVREDFSEVSNHLVERLSEFTEMLQFPVDQGGTDDLWGNWIETLSTRLDALNSLCTNVEGLLKTAIATIKENFVFQINTLTRNLSPIYRELEPETDEVGQHVSEQLDILKKHQAEELEELRTMWQRIIDVLNKKIGRARSFVVDLTAISMNHLSRINKVHSHMEAALKKSHNACQNQDEQINKQIKVQMKAVREARDLDTLNTLNEALENTFQVLAENWEDNYEAQLDIVEAVKSEDVENLFREKISEINEFLLVKYPKREWFSETFPPYHEMNAPNNDINTHIDQCNKYMEAVENRTFGMYEMLERYVPVCETSVKEEAEEWLNMYVQEIVDQYENRLDDIRETHIDTLGKTKKTRSAELQLHSERLRCHAAGVKAIMAELSGQFEEVKSRHRSLLATFNERVASVSESREDEPTRTIREAIFELGNEWNSMSESLENYIVQARSNCDNKCNILKRSNESFSKTAKSFKNGGNYSPEELKVLNKELKQLEKMFLSQKKTLLHNYNSLMKGITREALDYSILQMQARLDKATLQDNIQDTLNVTRIRLRTEVNNMRAIGKDLANEIKYLGCSGKLDENVVNATVEMADIIYNYMKFPVGVLTLECAESGQKSVVSVNTNKHSESTKKSSFEPNLLFKHVTDDILSEENNFLARTKGLLLKKYTASLQSIQDTFKVKPLITKTKSKALGAKKKEQSKVVEPDHAADHIRRLKSALQTYNVECELIWLEQVRAFLNQIVSLREVVKSLIQQELQTAHTTYLNSLLGEERDHQKKIQDEVRDWEFKSEKIRQTLKLPLAHPTHQHKLLALHKEAVELCKSRDKINRNLLIVYRNELQNHHDKYVGQVRSSMERLDRTQTLVFDKDVSNLLFENYKTLTNLIPSKRVLKTEIEESPGEAEQVKFPKSIWSDADESDDWSANNSSKHSISRTNIETQMNKVDKINKTSINRIATKNVKESAEQIQKLYDEAKVNRKSWQKAAVAWLKSFEYDINQAKLIYKPTCK